MKLGRSCRTLLSAPFLVSVPLLMISTGSVFAQTDETGATEFELINEYDLGFDQSDLGNVAQAAGMEYAEGNRSLAQAKKLRRRIAETDDPGKRAKLEAKLDETYASAVQSFTEAIGYAPKMAEAFAGLGEAYREWGQLEKSLEIHAAAVRRFPDDLENFEGWTLTLLDSNMLGNAVNSYTQYVDTNPDRATILMEAMKDWLRQRQEDPGELDPADVQRLADWIQQQG